MNSETIWIFLGLLTAIISVLIFSFSHFITRKCPKCGKKMRRLPLKLRGIGSESFKFNCDICKYELDTSIENRNG